MTTTNGDRVTNATLYKELGELREHIDEKVDERPTHKVVGLMIAVGVVATSFLNAAPAGVNTQAEAWFRAFL